MTASICDALNLLKFFSRMRFEINSYLEIGVCEGFSLKEILQSFPNILDVVLCDDWGALYGGTNRKSHNHIISMLEEINFVVDSVTFLDGNSRELLPQFFSEYPDRIFDLGFVDGNHSEDGMLADLSIVINHANVIVVHDVRHPRHLYLLPATRRFFSRPKIRERYVYMDDGDQTVILLAKDFLRSF